MNRWPTQAEEGPMTVSFTSTRAGKSETKTTSRYSQVWLPRKSGSKKTIPKAWRSSMRFWNRPPRLSDLRALPCAPAGARPRAPDSSAVLHFGNPRFCSETISLVAWGWHMVDVYLSDKRDLLVVKKGFPMSLLGAPGNGARARRRLSKSVTRLGQRFSGRATTCAR
jgi:hypothetical protein